MASLRARRVNAVCSQAHRTLLLAGGRGATGEAAEPRGMMELYDEGHAGCT